jgi:hypothetical protein
VFHPRLSPEEARRADDLATDGLSAGPFRSSRILRTRQRRRLAGFLSGSGRRPYGDRYRPLLARSPQEIRRSRTPGAVERWTRDIKAHRGLDDVSLRGGVVTYNELALYDVTLTFTDGTTKSLQTSLVRVDGDWYINAAL